MFYVVVKKDKMVTERLDAQIEQKKKNAHYNNTSYNNDNTIVTISRYVENSCMFAPGIFSYGQAY